MREIKFRAWDKTKKRWEWFSLSFILQAPAQAIYNFMGGDCFEQKSVSQWTGLKDKNGEEIYEGDIVSYMGNAHQVRWDRATASFQIDASSAVSDQEAGVNLAQSIVIGNIYESSLEEQR